MSLRGRGGIGRHDGLKIRCSKMRGGSSPPVPIKLKRLLKFSNFCKTTKVVLDFY